LARALAEALDMPCFSKDEIKELLFDTLGVGDVDWSKRLGSAAMEILCSVTAELPTAVIDCNFRPIGADRFTTPDARVVEVFCHVPPEVAERRFAHRSRHEGHRDAERLGEVAGWIAVAEPLRIGPHREVDTTCAVDVPALAQWVRNSFG